MRAQHEEVMKLRHDMSGHYEAIRAMTTDPKTAEYLDTLIGQNKQIRSIVHTGNQTLDIVLGGKLSVAADAGIKVDVQRSFAPEKLEIDDADLCSLMMNMMNNAITGAQNSGIPEPQITIDIHVKDRWLAVNCTNSADPSKIFIQKRRNHAEARFGSENYGGHRKSVSRSVHHRNREGRFQGDGDLPAFPVRSIIEIIREGFVDLGIPVSADGNGCLAS